MLSKFVKNILLYVKYLLHLHKFYPQSMLPNKCQRVAYIAILSILIALLFTILFSISLSRMVSHVRIAIVLMSLVVMLFSKEKVEDEMVKTLRMKAISKTAVIYFCLIIALRVIMLFTSKEAREFIADINSDAGIVVLFAIYYYNSFKRSIGKRADVI